MKKDIIYNLSLSAFLGALIWALSPSITGLTEPWNADSAYYLVVLLLAETILTVLGKRPIWSIYIGIVICQLLFILFFLHLAPPFFVYRHFAYGHIQLAVSSDSGSIKTIT